MKKITCICAALVFLVLGGINIKAAAESPDPLPTIPLSSNSSGTINFQVDDLSIYSQSKLVYLKNLSASEVEPYIRARLSKFGKVQINDQENLLIVSDREPIIFSKKVENDVTSELAFVITPHIIESPITSSDNLKKLEEDIK